MSESTWPQYRERHTFDCLRCAQDNMIQFTGCWCALVEYQRGCAR